MSEVSNAIATPVDNKPIASTSLLKLAAAPFYPQETSAFDAPVFVYCYDYAQVYKRLLCS